MTAPIDSELLTFAERIAAEAAAITLHWFQSRDLKVDLKKDNTEVTDADKAVEEYLRKEIGKEFPHDTIIGEESDNFSGTSSVASKAVRMATTPGAFFASLQSK